MTSHYEYNPILESAIVYKLCNIDEKIKDIFIGSGISLNNIESNHKNGCRKWTNSNYNTKVHQFIRENGDWSQWNIRIIRQYKNVDRYKLMKKTKKYILKYQPSLNEKEIARSYREDNLQSVACECGCVISRKSVKAHIKTKKHKELMKLIQV
jgi:hypothetical protein